VPDISQQLKAPLTTVQWTVSVYLLALAATLPATAYLGRRFGTVRVYGWSLAAFTLTSALCAVAPTAPILIAARALQGAAAAPLVPLSMNLLFGRGDTKDLPSSGALVLFLGPALGPTIGGLLVATWGWPSIFLVNLPFGAAALLFIGRLRKEGFVDQTDRSVRFDPVGLVLLSVGLTAAIYGASEAPSRGWWSTGAWPYWSAGLVLLTAYVIWALGRPEPAVDLRLLRTGRSALTMGLCVLASVAMFGVLFLLPVLVQTIQGHGALAAGLVLLPQGLVMGVSTGLGRNLTGLRMKMGIIAGFVAIALTSVLLVLVTVRTPLWIVALVMAGRGLGVGLVITPLLTGMLGGLPERDLAHANTLFNVGQRLGGSIGVSLLATLFSLRVADHLKAALGPLAASVSSHAGALSDAPPAIRPVVTSAALTGFHETIWAAAVVALLGVIGAVALRVSTPPDAAMPQTRDAPEEAHQSV
ncbi:MAG: DHA2 family efflux MFS transporter permease subunit, partial [Betaproteobacteria bacterium]